jgi:hypothetical protein
LSIIGQEREVRPKDEGDTQKCDATCFDSIM